MNQWLTIAFKFSTGVVFGKWVTKRGFKTKRDALQWEKEFQLQQQGSVEMSFADFVNVYREDRVARLKESKLIWNKPEAEFASDYLPLSHGCRMA